MLLCPVRALRIYLNRTQPLVPHPRTRFFSPKKSYIGLVEECFDFLPEGGYLSALASSPGPGPSTSARAHSVRGMATSAAFCRNFFCEGR